MRRAPYGFLGSLRHILPIGESLDENLRMSSRQIVVSYRLDLRSGYEVAIARIDRLVRLNPRQVQAAVQFEQINELPTSLTHWSKATIPEKVWMAWVEYFMRRWCFVDLPYGRESLWQSLFLHGGSSELYNDLMEISAVHLNGLYWLSSPNYANMSRNVQRLRYDQHFLTIYCEMESPAGPIATHLLSGNPP